MEIDFKHYRYQRPSERRKRKKRNLIILLILLIGFSLLAWDQISSFYIIKGKKLILNGKYDQAEKVLIKALAFKRKKTEIYDALGICCLCQKKSPAKYFQLALKKGIKKSLLNWKEILDKLISRGEYDSAEIYINYLKKWLKSQDLFFYEATILLANYEIKSAEKIINNYPQNVLKKFEKRVNLQKKILKNLKDKKIFYFVFDRKHKPLYGKNIIEKDNIIPVHSSLPVFNWRAFPKKDFKNQIILTINSKIQYSAVKALGKYYGSIVAINPQTGEILAAVSKKAKNDASYLNPCFQKLYEPGSIIKLLTAVAFLEEKRENFFPYFCKGVEKIDGKVLYDWLSHGKIKDLPEALTFSCNLAFAKIGLNLGWEKVEKVFNKFLACKEIKIEGIPLTSPQIPQKIENEWDLARTCIGLNKLKITPFHAVLIASVIANRGILMKPFLIKEKRNIYGIPYFKKFPCEIKRVISEEISYKLRDAMVEVVEKGTGKRAKIKGLQFSLKTGTAGEKKKGYNSILIGFAPALNPKIAFSIFAEGAGRADVEGAKITKRFLESIREELK